MERRVLRRRRPALSCISCRRRKIKCDRSYPCRQCVAINGRCAFRQLADGPETALTPASSSHEVPAAEAQRFLGAEETATPPAPSPLQGHQQQTETGPADLPLNKKHSLAEDLAETNRRILCRQSGIGEPDVILNKTRILRWSNWVGAAKEFQVIGACFSEALGESSSPLFQAEEIQELTREMGTLLAKCKAASRTLKVGRPARCFFSTLELPSAPSRDVADEMIQLYFDSFESCFRIMHAPTCWTDLDCLYDTSQNTKVDQRLRVLIVIALGSGLCTAETRTREGLGDKIHQWIYAAETWLAGPLEKDRLSLGGIQLHALVILARQVFSIGGDLVWTSVGSLVHRAMQIGLHRDPKHLPSMPRLEAELRRRLWATVIELALQASIDSALPPRLSMDEFDAEAPANIKDEDLADGSDPSVASMKQKFTPTSLQITLLRSFPVRLRTVQRLNSLRSALTYTEMLELSRQIIDVCQQHTQFIKDHAHDGITPFHRNMLDYLVRRLLIPLHCSFANEARANPVFQYSLKTNLEVAVAIISPEADDGWTQLMLIGGGMFREGIRYANTVIGLEVIAQAEAQSRDGTSRGGNAEYVAWLRGLIHQMMDLAARRIALGETNVKSHMFMGMILAQISCIERGVSCEHNVAKGARDSLQLCYEMLMERTGQSALPSPSAGTVDMEDWNDHWAGFDLGLFLHDAVLD